VLKVKKIILIISLLSLLVLTSCTVQIGGDYTTFNEIFFSSSADIETRGLLGSIVKDQVIYI